MTTPATKGRRRVSSALTKGLEMTQTLIAKAADLLHGGKAALREKYRTLIRIDGGSVTDARAFAGVLEELDITPAQAEADAAAVREYEAKRAAMPAPEHIDQLRLETSQRSTERERGIDKAIKARIEAVRMLREATLAEKAIRAEQAADEKALATVLDRASAIEVELSEIRARCPQAFPPLPRHQQEQHIDTHEQEPT